MAARWTEERRHAGGAWVLGAEGVGDNSELIGCWDMGGGGGGRDKRRGPWGSFNWNRQGDVSLGS